MAVVDSQQRLEPNSDKDGGNDNWEEELTALDGKTPESDSATPKKDGVPEDHPTKLGRKVKELTEEFSSIKSRLDQFLTQQQEVLSRTQERRVESTERPAQPAEDDDIPEHIKEVLPYVKRELTRDQEKSEKAKQGWLDSYINAVRKPNPEVDEELHKAVVDELLDKNFRAYKRITDDPVYNAQVNYDLAVASILKRQRKGAAAKPNVKGDQENPPLGLSSSSSNVVNPVKKVEPDEFAKKFLRAVGAKEDDPWVQESLRNAK